MKQIIICMLLLCAAGYSRACTVCGCAASNQSLGVLPQLNKHFLGLQYQYRSFESRHPGHDGHSQGTTSQEHYSTVQAWGRYQLGKRIQLFAFVPYVSNLKKETGDRTVVSGLGDITVLANYRILGLRDELRNEGWRQSLLAGGGIKLPTGHYDAASVSTENGLPNMQPGTSSWDFVGNLNYTLRYQQSGLNVDASYTLTTPNRVNYKYGNRLSAGLLAFWLYEQKSFSLLPQAGIRMELAAGDYEHYGYRLRNDMSGGEQLYLSAGAQAYYGRLGMQIMYHHPLSQHYASGLVKTRQKAEAGVFILF